MKKYNNLGFPPLLKILFVEEVRRRRSNKRMIDFLVRTEKMPTEAGSNSKGKPISQFFNNLFNEACTIVHTYFNWPKQARTKFISVGVFKAKVFFMNHLAPVPVAEFIDPVFVKTSRKRSFYMTKNERFRLVFVKTGSINSGTGHFGCDFSRKLEKIFKSQIHLARQSLYA